MLTNLEKGWNNVAGVAGCGGWCVEVCERRYKYSLLDWDHMCAKLHALFSILSEGKQISGPLQRHNCAAHKNVRGSL